jgi:hypothetical protein
MKALLHAANFLGRTRKNLRYGAYSREPLLLLRLEWNGDSVECDWLMRSPDPWDEDLPRRAANENRTRQSLADAMSLRDSVFDEFPAVNNARLRMYRYDPDRRLELVMAGNVSRQNEVLRRVSSIVMRARLCGFQFTLDKDGLETISAA